MDFKLLIRRFLAFVIDWNILFGIAMALMLFGPGTNPEFVRYPSIRMLAAPGFLLGCLWFVVYGLGKDCFFGRKSLGKLMFGLEIRNRETDEKASYGSLILRNLTYGFPQIEGVVVLANKGIRVGDLLGNTKVVLRKQ